MRQRRPSGMVAVLFTDLVGSTELMARLGEAAFDELRRAHFAALAEAIERTGGEEIKNTGDGVMVTFGSVVDAIGCAVAMQQMTERQARTTETLLAIKVGLSVGEVTFEGDDVFGAPVVEAARLVAAAASGQIVTTVIAKALVAGRAEADFVDLGPLELKGLPQPVAACEVLWEPLPEPTLPIPGLLTDVGRIFVGRDALTFDPETERYRLFDAVAGWLGTASSEGPVLLVLDDLQWAAKPTLLLLRHVVRSVDPMRILTLGTYRDTELRHDPATLAYVLAVVWSATWDPAGLAVRAGLVAELAELAEQLGDHLLEFHAGIALFLTAMQQGDVDRADAGLEVSGRVAEQLGQPVLRWRVLYTRVNRAMAAGRFDDPERLAEEALQLGEAAGQPDSETYYHAGLASIRLLQGRYAEAAPLCERFRGGMPFLGALAWAYAELNRLDEARAIVEELRPRRFAGLPRDHTRLITVSFLGRACSRLPDLDAAAELYELLLPHRSEIVAYHAGWSGPVSHDLGLLATRLGRYNEADTHFAATMELLEHIDSPAWLAHTRIEWARMLLSRQEPADAERARKLLDQALATARELGLANVEQRAVALLQECP